MQRYATAIFTTMPKHPFWQRYSTFCCIYDKVTSVDFGTFFISKHQSCSLYNNFTVATFPIEVNVSNDVIVDLLHRVNF